MTALKIIKRYLTKRGFGGLYLPGECGCDIENLMPCCMDFSECKPGYKRLCDSCDIKGCEIREKESYCIGPKK